MFHVARFQVIFFVHLVNEKEVTASVWPRKECDTQKCGTHIRGAIGNWTWLAADISCFCYWSHLMTDKCQGNPGMRLSAVWTLAVAAREEPTYYLVKTTADIAEIIIIIKYMYTISNILIKIVFFCFFLHKIQIFMDKCFVIELDALEIIRY